MANRKQLGVLLVGALLCGGARAQQQSSTGVTSITFTDANGKPVLTQSILATDRATANALANDLLSSGLIGGGATGFSLARQGGILGTGSAAAAGGNRWNLWAAASYNRVGSSFQPLQTGGTVGVLTAGLDYRFSDNLLIGAALAGDRSRVSLNYVAGGGNLAGNGLTLAPYLAYMFNPSWLLDASVGYGRSDYDASGGGVTGSFRGTRTLGNIGLNYRQGIAGSRWQLSGRGALMSVSSDTGSFTASNGVFSDSTSSKLVQLRLGGQVAYAAGQVTPYFGLTYVYDIRRLGSVTVGGQTSSGDRDSWVPAIGLRFSSGGSLYGGLQLSSERSRSEVKNDQLQLNLGVRF
jgi:hypothetical protein